MDSLKVDKFIEEHRHLPLYEVALILGKNPQLPKKYILNQINGWQKTVHKLPEWHSSKGIFYPDNTALEQCSSEQTAKYKATLIKGNSMADLSGGLGVDAYYFSRNYTSAHYVEPNPERFRTAVKNFKTLSAQNIKSHNCTAEKFLGQSQSFDLIYLDPDRRGGNKKRVVKIENCTPNVLELQDKIYNKSRNFIVKYSPMLDISLALSSLNFIKEVHVIAVNNECKELLFMGEKNWSKATEIKTINFTANQTQSFNFFIQDENNIKVETGNVKSFIYEPNSAILKAGAFKSIARQYHLFKLAANSHLYTSNKSSHDFPGRLFKVISMESSKGIKGIKANVITRNFPMKAETIQSKYKIKNGGNDFIIATSLNNGEKIFIKAERVINH